MQSMTPEENGRLQLLFEDSMSTLTSAVEQLSHDLSQELTLLSDAILAVKEPIDVAPVTPIQPNKVRNML